MVSGGGNIVFGTKRSNQWMQWNSCMWLWVTLSLGQKGQTSGGSGCRGKAVYGGGDIAPKIMFPPPYTTIPLRPLESPLCNSYTT